MKNITKAELEKENVELKEKVHIMTFEMSKLDADCIHLRGLLGESNRMYEAAVLVIDKLTPKQNTSTRVPKEERLVNLDRFQPHSKMHCSEHGDVTANREGYCFHCYCECLGRPKVAA